MVIARGFRIITRIRSGATHVETDGPNEITTTGKYLWTNLRTVCVRDIANVLTVFGHDGAASTV